MSTMFQYRKTFYTKSVLFPAFYDNYTNRDLKNKNK